jgi:Cu-Zn family superoxide dismutase
VGDGGRADVNVEVTGAQARAGLPAFLGLGENGLALVIHAGVDDEMTDPSGNSGARIACAALN